MQADRGVWQAPWISRSGELVLIAITSNHQLACAPVVVPNGASRVLAAEELMERLDKIDPLPRCTSKRVTNYRRNRIEIAPTEVVR